ncbi:MAG: hypothetical protein ACJAUL_003498 [Paraglaciecola sp.]
MFIIFIGALSKRGQFDNRQANSDCLADGFKGKVQQNLSQPQECTMKRFLHLTRHFLLAVLVSFILASLAHSQFVLFELAKVGVQIDMASRVSMTLDDLLGLRQSYGPAIALGLLLAFAVMGAIRKYRPHTTPWVYPLGGALAMLVMLLAMQPIMHITLIAGARTPFGILAQCAAGFAGGWVFMKLRKSPPRE